jgi:single-strand DNA-binding protein
MMNRVCLIGRITKEPEIKYTQSGNAVVSFSLAVDREFKDEQGNSITDFINCVAWRQQAEFIANYIKKGYLIAIQGALQTRSWQTSNGENRSITEVIIDSVKNLTPKDNAPEEKPNANAVNDSDLPF